MNITIDPEIHKLWPNFAVAALTMSITLIEHPEISDLIQDYESKLSKKYNITDVVTLPIIKDGRDAYKAFGKDPSRYRLAVESLFRRIVKGNPLYRINNVVDAGNILSLQTRKSVAVLDKAEIIGDVTIRLGTASDVYTGIGRGLINIDRIPLYEDSIGPFGSTTSDTDRTKITKSTTEILLFIISFSGQNPLTKDIDFAYKLFEEYCNAVFHTIQII